jgi:phage shock protein PspC (stress-responsive transcriptional regulator)
MPVGQAVPSKPLVRPVIGRQIAGVCLALAHANGWDVGVVRILAVLGFFFSSGFLGVAYVAGWIGIPDERDHLPGAYPPGI